MNLVALTHAFKIKTVFQLMTGGIQKRMLIRLILVSQNLQFTNAGRARPSPAVHAAAIGLAHITDFL